MAELLRLAIIGDPHIAVPQGDPDPRLEVDPGRKLHGLSRQLLEATVRAVNAERPDAALILGDMTRDCELFNHEAALAIVSRLDCQYYIMAGNHDLLRTRAPGVVYPGVELLDREGFIEFYSGRGLPERATNYSVELGGSSLIVLDSNLQLRRLAELGEPLERQDDGFIEDSQLAWLDAQIRDARSGGRLPLVALHHTVMDQTPAEQPGHPLYDAFRFWQVRDPARILELLARHRVPLVLSGHLHAQSVNVLDRITNLVTSAAVTYPHHWRMLTLTPEAIVIESKSIASELEPGFHEWSRQQLGYGMGLVIHKQASAHPLLAPHADAIRELAVNSGWWQRFSDGTLAGFAVDPELLREADPIRRQVLARIAGMLNSYGEWKAQRPDPGYIELPLSR